MQDRYHVIEDVYQRITPGLRAEVAAFWRDQRAIQDPAERARRALELACVMRDRYGAIAGVSTVFETRLHMDDETLTAPFYRHFIRPDSRGGRDFVRLFACTCEAILRARAEAPPSYIAFSAENRKMIRTGLMRFLASRGLRRLPTAEGRPHIWLFSLREDGPHRRYLPG